MDIVERLRHHKSSDVWTERKDRTWYETDDLCMEAADEIERLQKQAHYHYENGLKKEVEIESLRDALRWAAPYTKDHLRVSAIIKAALKESE
jgi:hypothetical protein